MNTENCLSVLAFLQNEVRENMKGKSESKDKLLASKMARFKL